MVRKNVSADAAKVIEKRGISLLRRMRHFIPRQNRGQEVTTRVRYSGSGKSGDIVPSHLTWNGKFVFSELRRRLSLSPYKETITSASRLSRLSFRNQDRLRAKDGAILKAA
jgi:hypothetical protein